MISRLSLVFSDFFTRGHWLNIVLTRKTFDDTFSAFGKIWLLINVTSFVLPTTKPYLSDNSYLLIVVIFAVVVWVSRPRLSVLSNVKNCDMQIEIQVGNLFDFRGACVIGTNSTFDVDTSTGVISPNSLQGQFASRLYKNKFSELDADLELALNGLEFDELNDGREGKKNRYPLGTVVQLRKSNKIFYMVLMNRKLIYLLLKKSNIFLVMKKLKKIDIIYLRIKDIIHLLFVKTLSKFQKFTDKKFGRGLVYLEKTIMVNLNGLKCQN